MRVGYFSSTWAGGISPAELGIELERRGFDSLWLPEHSHIPVDREPTPPFGTAISSRRSNSGSGREGGQTAAAGLFCTGIGTHSPFTLKSGVCAGVAQVVRAKVS